MYCKILVDDQRMITIILLLFVQYRPDTFWGPVQNGVKNSKKKKKRDHLEIIRNLS